MKDRIPSPGMAGRVLVTPEDGSAPFYATITMADEPTEGGTALNKANLLTDDTAALFGKDSAAVPNDIFDWLGQYNTHWWSALHGEASYGYEEKRTDITKNHFIMDETDITIYFSSEISIDQTTGAISLVDPQELFIENSKSGMTEGAAALAAIAPCYITGLYGNDGKVFYLPEGTTSAPYAGPDGCAIYYDLYEDANYGYMYLSYGGEPCAQLVTASVFSIAAGETTYVNSTDPDAYPNGEIVDGVTYAYLGVPLQKFPAMPQIATGSYVGTGVYGKSNPNSLTFDFEPKLVIITGKARSAEGYYQTMFVIKDAEVATVLTYTPDVYASQQVIAWSDNTLIWYFNGTGDVDSYNQLNGGGITYHYIAIG